MSEVSVYVTYGAYSALVAGVVLLLWYVSARVRSSFFFLGKDDQLRIQGYTEISVKNGPGLRFLMPFTYKSTRVIKATTLGQVSYAKVLDKMTGEERTEEGPKLLFLGPYDECNKMENGISLNSLEYVKVQNHLTGKESIVKGPCVWIPKQYETGTSHQAISLGSTNYVLSQCLLTGSKTVCPGPCVFFPPPATHNTVKNGTSLNSTEYVLVTDDVSGEKHIEKGPKVWFPSPSESGEKQIAVSLSSTQYIVVDNHISGSKTLIKGPRVWYPAPHEESSDIQEAIALQHDEYVRVKNLSTGDRWVKRGKALLFVEPTWELETPVSSLRHAKSPKPTPIMKAWVLKSYEFVRLLNETMGTVRVQRGEATVFPEADEVCLDADKLRAIDLKVNEFAKILDKSTGKVRVVGGTGQVFLGPHELLLGGKRVALEVDDERAVLVRNKNDGQLRLVTKKELFIPGPFDSIVEVRHVIKLAEHEAAIVKDEDSDYKYYYGAEGKNENPRSFFLSPYGEIVKLCWSRGRRRESRDLYIERFDCRAQFMSFEFNSRTRDNVELVLEGTFFWAVEDLPLMVKTTGNTSGDICNHARSQFIKHVARVTLQEFMNDLTNIANAVYKENVSFYHTRGVRVDSLEVTSYRCAEATTSAILQQIIAETTNRMNRLSQQESENEVNLFKMQGQIEQAKLNESLLKIQHQHEVDDAEVSGKAEAERVCSFIKGMNQQVPNFEERSKMWHTLRKNEALTSLSHSAGGSTIYFTPKDVNLTIENNK